MQVLKPNATIQRGMSVCDVNGDNFGFVAFVFEGKEKANLDIMGLRDLKVTMQRLMGCTVDFPVAVYSRFYHDGFISVQNATRKWYFIPQQVNIIRGKYIHLQVAKDELMSDDLK